jgi:hypothetical protein
VMVVIVRRCDSIAQGGNGDRQRAGRAAAVQ